MRAQKIQNGFRKLLAVTVVAGGLTLMAASGSAQSSPHAAMTLTPAVAEVIKLAQAKVSDSTIVAYIQYAGQNYALNADEILYLRQQGVSEAVIMAMLHPSTAPAMPATTIPMPSTPAPQPVASPGYTEAEPYFDSGDNTYYDYDPYYYPAYYGGYYWPGPFVFSYGWGGWGRRGYGYGGWHGGNGWHGGGAIHGTAPAGGWHGGGGSGGGWHGGGGFGGGHGGGFGGGGRR